MANNLTQRDTLLKKQDVLLGKLNRQLAALHQELQKKDTALEQLQEDHNEMKLTNKKFQDKIVYLEENVLVNMNLRREKEKRHEMSKLQNHDISRIARVTP